MRSTLAGGRPKRTVDNYEYLRMVARMVAAAGARVAEADPEDLSALLRLRDLVDNAILDAVRGLRSSGTTWEDIGLACGTTRQAALMRWGPKLEENSPGLTPRRQR